MTRRQIDAAVQAGDLVKIDRCRLAKRNADPDAIKAARAGASLTCVSALQKLGSGGSTRESPPHEAASLLSANSGASVRNTPVQDP